MCSGFVFLSLYAKVGAQPREGELSPVVTFDMDSPLPIRNVVLEAVLCA